MFGKNMYLILAITVVLAISGISAWFYLWSELPEKIPVPSKQVFLMTEGRLAHFGKYNIGFEVYTMTAKEIEVNKEELRLWL